MSNIIQGSPEWFSMRCGFVTASRVVDVLATIKNGEAATRKSYKADLVVERLTGQKTESFTNAAMQWGTDTEQQARMAYEIKTGNDVDLDSFVKHPRIDWFGCSPDGYVGEDGLIEIKCPYNTAIHLEYIEADEPPKKYYTQMQAQMACTDRKWCDFVSFDPRLPDGLEILIVRVERDDDFIANMEEEVKKFLSEVQQKVELLKEKQNG